MSQPHLTDEQVLAWAKTRADDAGRLAREFVELRASWRERGDVLKEMTELWCALDGEDDLTRRAHAALLDVTERELYAKEQQRS